MIDYVLLQEVVLKTPLPVEGTRPHDMKEKQWLGQGDYYC
jgi:hypothetical protein